MTLIVEKLNEMRDGVRLSSDVSFPGDGTKPGGYPVVLERTPYGKRHYGRPDSDRNEPRAADYAAYGYVFVRQDCRGRHGSEGVFRSYEQEGDDGLDTIEWVRTQPWCDGRVVVTGSSYYAVTAQAILAQNPPGLAAAMIRVGPGNYHEDGAWQGGAFLLAHNINYLMLLATTCQAALADPALHERLQQQNGGLRIDQMLRQQHLLRNEPPLSLLGEEAEWYLRWQHHEGFDAYWRQLGNSFTSFYQQAADVPVLLLGQWYDAFVGGMLDAWHGYSGRKSPVELVMGGGEHQSVYSLSTVVGDVDLGPSSPIRVHDEMLRWLALHVPSSVSPEVADDPGRSRARVFRIGGGTGIRQADGHFAVGGQWQTFDCWPPTDAVETSYYLDAAGRLSGSVPPEGRVTYRYDPADPAPCLGGSVSSGGSAVLAGPYDQRGTSASPGRGAPITDRADVCSFIGPAITEPVELSGKVAVHLWVSSSAIDTDFFARLIDQYPDNDTAPGLAMNLTDAMVRLRWRAFEQAEHQMRRVHGVREEPVTPGTIVEVELDLIGVSVLLMPGHRIRLDVSSSHFPKFDVNPNTGEAFGARSGKMIVAENTIHVGASCPSRIILPVRTVDTRR